MIRALLFVAAVASSTAHAFPPYRLTDAGTADPWWLEGRFGVRVFRSAGDNAYSAPALRINLGLPRDIEIVSELEIEPEEPAIADAAIGAKIVRAGKPLSIGIEVLALLPVSSEGGAGSEASLLATYRPGLFRFHVNVAGFYDARGPSSEYGPKGGVLAEAAFGRVRPGVELFAKHVIDGDTKLLAGAGVIVAITSQLDMRTGVHVGLTDASDDIVASVWLAGKLAVR